MKTKLVLLILAAMGSTALVASAQTPRSFTVTTDRAVDAQDFVATVPAPPQPPAPVAVPASPARNAFIVNRPQVFTSFYSTDDNSTSHQAEQLAQQLASAKSDSEREKIKEQFSDLLGKQFDQRQKRHEEEIKQLEAQIKKLRGDFHA